MIFHGTTTRLALLVLTLSQVSGFLLQITSPVIDAGQTDEGNKTIEELLTLVQEKEAQIDTQLALMENRINETEYNVTSLKASVDQLNLVVQDLVHTVQDFISKNNSSVKNEVDQLWPYGNYGLMATSSGCPDNAGVSWTTGYRKHNTESDDINHDQVSSGNHLLQPVMEEDNSIHFFYQHFCIAPYSRSKYFWPSGTYCINKYTDNCPYGFQSAYTKIDEEDNSTLSSSNEDNSTLSSSNGTLPEGGFIEYMDYSFTLFTIYYCCRADAPANAPLDLPTGKPFYLYRYKGQCQLVTGMNVAEESFLIDTENDQNADKYESDDIHPDGQASDDVMINLCYYSPVKN